MDTEGREHSRGIVYIAFGEKYTAEAAASAASARRACGEIAIALITSEDSPVPDNAFDIVLRRPMTHMRAKVDYLALSPFARSLYLDSDTLVARDISDIFDALDKHNVAMCHSFTRKRARWSREIPEYDAIPYAFSEFDGGVIAYDSSEVTQRFLACWRDRFEKYRDITQGWDQASLRIAAWSSGVKVCTLPVEFNVRAAAHRKRVDKLRASGEDPDVMRPRIVHWHGVHDADWLRRHFSPKYRRYRY